VDENFWNARYAAAENVWSLTPNQFVVEHLSSLIEAKPAGKMLDLAGGEGRNALWFAMRGWQAEVIDFSSIALEKFAARAAAAEAAEVEAGGKAGLASRCFGTVADATNPWQAKLAPADLLLVAYLQLEAAPLADAISAAVSQLAPDATVFIVNHALENLTRGAGGPQDGRYLQTIEQFEALAGANRLKIETLKLVERQFLAGEETKTAVDVILKGRLG
jgi:SAM-dependent methyltransferase